MTDPRHDTTVEPVTSGAVAGLHGYRAACCCGWRGPTLTKKRQAQTDAVEHAVGHPVKAPPSPGQGWPSGN